MWGPNLGSDTALTSSFCSVVSYLSIRQDILPRRLSTRVVRFLNLSNLSGLWPSFLSLISIADLSHAKQNHRRLQFESETKWLYISDGKLRHSAHFHLSGACHRSHCKPFTSQPITIPHAIHDELAFVCGFWDYVLLDEDNAGEVESRNCILFGRSCSILFGRLPFDTLCSAFHHL